jgi:hypothetical protein
MRSRLLLGQAVAAKESKNAPLLGEGNAVPQLGEDAAEVTHDVVEVLLFGALITSPPPSSSS